MPAASGDIGDLLQDAHGHDALVGDDQRLLAAEALQSIGNLGGEVWPTRVTVGMKKDVICPYACS